MALIENTKKYLIIHVAVGEHGVEISQTLMSFIVVVIQESLLDGAKVHWILYYGIIVLKQKTESDIFKNIFNNLTVNIIRK